MDFILTSHAEKVLASNERQNIQRDWIERVLTEPDYTDRDSRNGRIRVWKRIPENGNRALRVVCEPDSRPIEVVTVFFDRGYKR